MVVRSAKAPVIRPGVSANDTTAIVGPAIVSHSAGRHRCEGIRPSGNSRKIGMNDVSTTTIIQRSTQAARRPSGNDPGWMTSATIA